MSIIDVDNQDDFNSDDKVEADNCVTVRDRDTMEQIRMPISELKEYIAKKVAF